MKTMKPWSFNMNGCETSHRLPIIQAANGHVIAILNSHNINHSRLIAAAPELLAACQVAAQWLHDNCDENDEPLRIVRAAIAKATS
jgi:hypothetical protein